MSIARLHRRDTVERSGALFFSEAAIRAVARPTENAGVSPTSEIRGGLSPACRATAGSAPPWLQAPSRSLSPKILEPRWGNFGVADGVLHAPEPAQSILFGTNSSARVAPLDR